MNKYLSFALTSLLVSPLMAFMPWMSGPFWLDAIATFICSQFIYWIFNGSMKLYDLWKARKK